MGFIGDLGFGIKRGRFSWYSEFGKEKSFGLEVVFRLFIFVLVLVEGEKCKERGFGKREE